MNKKLGYLHFWKGFPLKVSFKWTYTQKWNSAFTVAGRDHLTICWAEILNYNTQTDGSQCTYVMYISV